ncbi:MAG: HAD-IC family P-type ATPase, partial [Gammaproteobacteria bacterium]|nr:HAD-IC family P-type ATPase [Gammaproteobacteria bacterium]
VLDKTGTLTNARMQLADVRCVGALPRSAALALAASLEQRSAHPLAAAFIGATTDRVAITDLREHAGHGIEGIVDGATWRIGKSDWVAQLRARTDPAAARPAAPAALTNADPDADDCIWLGSAAGHAAAFSVADTLRPDARAAVARLRSLGLEVRIASGDRRATIARVAAELGIAAAEGRMDPQAKLGLIRRLQAQGRHVLMVGDGINDGPVLAAAHASCAMGGGAALAHAAADLLLMNESLVGLAGAVQTARGATGLVRANLRWALGYNLCAVPLAAAGLVSPWLAALGMSASSLYVVERARRFARTDA